MVLHQTTLGLHEAHVTTLHIGIEPVSLALAGGFLTTGPPGKSNISRCFIPFLKGGLPDGTSCRPVLPTKAPHSHVV